MGQWDTALLSTAVRSQNALVPAVLRPRRLARPGRCIVTGKGVSHPGSSQSVRCTLGTGVDDLVGIKKPRRIRRSLAIGLPGCRIFGPRDLLLILFSMHATPHFSSRGKCLPSALRVPFRNGTAAACSCRLPARRKKL